MTKIAKLTADLRKRVQSGEWKTTLPNRSHLSTEYDVATGTVSLVLRNLEKEGLVQILPRKGVVVAPLSVRPDPKTLTIGLRGNYVQMGVPANLGYAGHLVNQLLEAARIKGYPLLILQTRPDEPPLTKERCRELGLSGLIYLGAESLQEAVNLRLEGFPVISANRPAGRSPLNYIDCDHAATLRDIIRRFVEAGHRRIAMVQSATIVPDALAFLKACFVETLIHHRLYYDFDAYSVYLSRPTENRDENLRQIDQLFAHNEPPTALFAWNQYSVDLVTHLLAQRGLTVPEDISLATVPIESPLSSTLSGYTYSHKTFGEELLNELNATIENPFHYVQRDLPFEFVDCGSIAPPSR